MSDEEMKESECAENECEGVTRLVWLFPDFLLLRPGLFGPWSFRAQAWPQQRAYRRTCCQESLCSSRLISKETLILPLKYYQVLPLFPLSSRQPKSATPENRPLSSPTCPLLIQDRHILELCMVLSLARSPRTDLAQSAPELTRGAFSTALSLSSD